MTIDKFDVVFLTLAFVVPGFVWDSVLTALVPRRAQTDQRTLLRLLTLSAINYGVSAPLLWALVRIPVFTQHPWRTAVTWPIVLLAIPALLGLLTGRLWQRDTLRHFLARLGVSATHPIPTAWDFMFSKGERLWVLVTLTDGSHVAGRFGYDSFASSDPSDRDLYLEHVYIIDDDTKAWQPTLFSRGILIRGKHIAHVECWQFR